MNGPSCSIFGSIVFADWEKLRVKRTLTCLVLFFASAFCLWFALSGASTPSHGPGGSKAAGSAGKGSSLASAGTMSGSAAGPQYPTSGGAAGGSISATPSPATTSTGAADSGTNTLSCRSGCQTGNSTCQSACYQQYTITTQTQSWSRCMQTCGTKLSVCSNNCVTGIKSSADSPTAMLPPALPAVPPPSRSAPTPPMSPQMPDSSSSSPSPAPSSSSPSSQ